MNMNPSLRLGLVVVAMLAGGHSLAQTAAAPTAAQAAGGTTPVTGAAAAASKPQTVPLYGQTYTPGWPMMSKEERAAHATAMTQFKSRAECVDYMGKHYEQMTKRSLQRGLPLQGNSRRDLCNVLPE